MRSTRYLHPIGCGCRTCLPPRSRGPIAEAALAAAAKVLGWCGDLLAMIDPPPHDCRRNAPHCGQTWLCYSCQQDAKR